MHPSPSSAGETLISEAKKLKGIKNKKAPIIIEASVLLVGEYDWNKQCMSKCLKDESQYNFDKIRKNTLKVAYFLD